VSAVRDVVGVGVAAEQDGSTLGRWSFLTNHAIGEMLDLLVGVNAHRHPHNQDKIHDG
jgi:hypothetical protein